MLSRFLKNCIVSIFLLVISVDAQAQEALIFAIDLVRHGDRTPIKEIPKSPIAWPEGLGELTKEGAAQELALGKALRKQYISEYHLLPDIYIPHTMYVRATYLPRTLASADALLLGLYPAKKRSDNEKIPVHIVVKEDDHLLIVKPTRNIFDLGKLYLTASKSWREKTYPIKNKIKYWSKQSGLPLNNFQQLISLADNLYIRQLHNKPLPNGFSEKDAAEITSLAEWGMVNGFKLPALSHPMGREFLTTVENYMRDAIQHKNSLRYVLFSAHDSSILSVLNTLGAPADHILPYASHLSFYLLEENDNYYVKVNYNNKPVVIPHCGKGICSLQQFLTL